MNVLLRHAEMEAHARTGYPASPVCAYLDIPVLYVKRRSMNVAAFHVAIQEHVSMETHRFRVSAATAFREPCVKRT